MAYQRGNRWYVKYREPDTGNQRTASFDSKEDAEYWQTKFKYDKKHNKKAVQPVTQQDRTLAGVIKAYYQSRRGEIKKSTIKSDFYRLNTVILPLIGGKAIRQLTKADIENVIDGYRARKNKNTSINRALDILRSVLKYAENMDLIKSAPNIRRLKDDKEVIKPPTPAEAKKLLSVALPHVKRTILLSCATGIRPGTSELFKVTWADIDFERAEMFVESAKKGGLAQRVVPLRADIMALLKEWFREDNEDISKTIIHWKGQPIKNHIRSGWKRALKKAGITRRLRPYDLRHHFATYALSAGSDIKSVADAMGHTDPSTTMRVYQHVLQRAKRDAVESLPSLTDGEG
ncbi:site-specific integrase [Marinifilum sp. JC120]|nr:site-specific integrase [Marinifilum sp. JC120]